MNLLFLYIDLIINIIREKDVLFFGLHAKGNIGAFKKGEYYGLSKFSGSKIIRPWNGSHEAAGFEW